MRPDPTPAAVGRSHALQRMVEHAESLARPPGPNLAEDDRAYLAAFNDTVRSIADRLRRSPGFDPWGHTP